MICIYSRVLLPLLLSICYITKRSTMKMLAVLTLVKCRTTKRHHIRRFGAISASYVSLGFCNLVHCATVAGSKVGWVTAGGCDLVKSVTKRVHRKPPVKARTFKRPAWKRPTCLQTSSTYAELQWNFNTAITTLKANGPRFLFAALQLKSNGFNGAAVV